MIYNGNKLDKTDFSSDKYLEINSCGFQNTVSEFSVIREKGRRDYHLLLVSAGKAEVLHDGQSFVLEPGNLVIYTPNEKHFYKLFGGTTTLWCHFNGTAVNEIFATHNIKSGVYFFKRNADVFGAFTNMIRNYHLESRKKHGITFLLELLFCISDEIEKKQETGNRNLIVSILTYINLNYNKNITLDCLAKKFGYSKSRFSHIFSTETNTTPIKYRNEIRLKTASEMLKSTNLNITDIAVSCGFDDALYFGKIFKKRYGISPSELRMQNEKE